MDSTWLLIHEMFVTLAPILFLVISYWSSYGPLLLQIDHTVVGVGHTGLNTTSPG